LLNLIAAIPQPLLNKNSSELSLPLLLLHFKKNLCCSDDAGSILKNLTLNFFLKNDVREKTQSKKIVVEQL